MDKVIQYKPLDPPQKFICIKDNWTGKGKLPKKGEFVLAVEVQLDGLEYYLKLQDYGNHKFVLKAFGGPIPDTLSQNELDRMQREIQYGLKSTFFDHL